MAEKKPATKSLSVDELILDAGTQSRVEISEHTVDRYVEVLEETKGIGWPFPPLVVFNDGSQYLVASGFHRTLSARRHGRASIPCEVHQGTAWDALLHGMGANNEHGLPPSHADNRHSVEILLDSGKRMSQKEIADIVGVATRTVRRIVADRKEAEDRTLSASGDQFGVEDPFEDEGVGEDGRTEPDGQDGQQEPPPGRSGESTEDPGDSSPTKDPFKTQRSKTVKTAEALMRAFDDLNSIHKDGNHAGAVKACKALVTTAKNWV